MFSLLVVSLCVLANNVYSQYTTEAAALCTLYSSTCEYANANVTAAYADQAACEMSAANNIDTLSCKFYHLGVAYYYLNLGTPNHTLKELHCGHASGVAPCNQTAGSSAQTGAQFCNENNGLFGQACLPWTVVNTTSANCAANYTAAYNSDQLCYTYNAAARLSAGGPFTSDSGGLCANALGAPGNGVCRELVFSSPAPTTPAPSVAGITATGITGDYALKNFIALNVPVALGVCYQAPSAGVPATPLGNVISCNSTGDLQHLRYSSASPAPTPAADVTDYLACTNTTGNIVTEQIDVAYGVCGNAAGAIGAYALTSICVIPGTSATNATACLDGVCDGSIGKITVPVLTDACVNSGYLSTLGSIYSIMTCTSTSLTYSSYAAATCPTAALVGSVTASSTANCTYLTSADVPIIGAAQVFLLYADGACVGQSTGDGDDAPTQTVAIILATVIASIMFV